MEKEPTGLRIVELHLIPDANGWVRLPPDLLQALGIQPGDMVSFYADESGFRVKGSKKPPYVHASTEKPPSSPTPLQTEAAPSPALSTPSADPTQMKLFDVPQPYKHLPRRRSR